MLTQEKMANTFTKQRLRAELDSHVEDFLKKGGQIEVVSGLGEPAPGSGFTRWAAATDTVLLPGLDHY